MGDAIRATRDASDVGAHFLLPFYGVQKLRAIGEALPNSTRHVVFDEEKLDCTRRTGKVLFAMECYKTAVSVRRSTRQHARAENGLVASRNFEMKDLAGSYYASLSYGNLKRKLQPKKQYRKVHMEVTAELYQKWAVKLKRELFWQQRQGIFCLGCSSFILCYAMYQRSLVPGERQRRSDKQRGGGEAAE